MVRRVYKPIFLYVLLNLFQHLLICQNRTVDSLKNAFKNAKHDTDRCRILSKLVEDADEEEWPVFNGQLKKLAEEKLKVKQTDSASNRIYLQYLANSINNLGYLENAKGNTLKALSYYEQSLDINERLKNKKSMADLYNNMGYVYDLRGDIPLALQYYEKSLRIYEAAGDKSGIATCLNNIAVVYDNLGDFQKAVFTYEKCFKLMEEIGDKKGMATALNNIGFVYNNRNEISEALAYNLKALKIEEEIKDKKGMGTSFNNIGVIYYRHGDPFCKAGKREECLRTGLDKALDYYTRALKIFEEGGEKSRISTLLSNVAGVYLKQKNYAKALSFSLKSMATSKEIGYPENIKTAAERLFQIYKETGNYMQALKNYELFILMRDSVSNEANKKASIKNQLKYEYEKRAAADSVKNAEEQKVKDAQLTAQNAQIKQERFQRYALLIGLVMVLAGLGFVINRFRITRRQKKIIERQKIIVDEAFEKLHEKNKEILDSIHYAKRIQTALLPNENYIARQLARCRA
jgi:tetratricopeptide (TPR) repeat protein